ncbi:M48 family metallopeptidase [bacterium SCSIO 12741]|nr:M48 family metallopeptidase [bacterium SCSIO 12741]
MKKPLSIAFLLLIAAIPTFAQLSKEDYRPLECKGEIPEVFLRLSSEISKEINEQNQYATESKRVRKQTENFYEMSNFMLDQILLSGDILFGATLTRYFNKIGKELMKDNPELQKKVTFFTFKSPHVNAFATDQGYIFVNVGLLAQVSNETELAFVLSHELVHYREQHNIQEFLETDLIKKGKGKYRYTSTSDRVNSYYQYSRELETEADKEGLKMLANTNYNIKKAKGLFDVLLYSYLPFDEEEFDRGFLGNSSFEFPEKYFLDSVKSISARDDVSDELSTHPNIRKRRDAALKRFKKLQKSSKGKSTYLTSKEEFRYVRDIARFEIIRQNLLMHRYDRAIYNCFLMKEDYPNNKWLDKCLIQALSGALAYKEQNKSSEAMSYYKKVEGYSQDVSYFLRKIKKKELAITTTAKAYEIYQKYPDDKYLAKYAEDLMYHLISFYELSLEDFTRDKEDESEDEDGDDEESASAESEDDEDEDEDDDEELSKYDKIKKKKSEDKEAMSDDEKYYYLNAFRSFFKDPDFEIMFEKAYSRYQKNTDISESERARMTKQAKKREKMIAKKGEALGIDELVVVDPTYLVIDDRGSNSKVNYAQSEGKKQDLKDKISDISSDIELKTTLLDPKVFDYSQTKEFNALMKMKEWISEMSSHEVDSVNSILLEELNQVSNSFNTPYVAVPACYNFTINENKGKYIWPMFFVVTIPWAIYKMVTPTEGTYIRFYVLDLKSGNSVFDEEYVFLHRDSDANVNSCLYDSMSQIKRR